MLGVVDLLESAPGGVFCGERVKVSQVGEEDAVVDCASFPGEEVGRDQLGALVQELVEGMLAVGAR